MATARVERFQNCEFKSPQNKRGEPEITDEPILFIPKKDAIPQIVSFSINKEGNPSEGEHDERKLLVEEWRKAPTNLKSDSYNYSGGVHKDKNGKLLYRYPAGTRLEIQYQGKIVQTMDSCEIPWCEAMVNQLTAGLKPVSETKRKPRFLVRGFGQGIDSTFIVQKMIALGGGVIHIVELNDEDADFAEKEWKEEQEKAIESQSRRLPEARPDISIEIFRGDAYEITEMFVSEARDKKGKIREDKKYDRILSDTVPLSQDEIGVNDLLDLGNLKELLRDDGLVGVYTHFPGTKGGVYGRQKDLIYNNGFVYSLDSVKVLPPPDYHYLHTEQDEPVTELSVVVCRKRRP